MKITTTSTTRTIAGGPDGNGGTVAILPATDSLLDALADQGATARVMGSSTLTLGHLAAGRCTGAVIRAAAPRPPAAL